jgi:hypothetical protein
MFPIAAVSPASLRARRSARPRNPNDLASGRGDRGHLHRNRHDLQLQRADQFRNKRFEHYCINHTFVLRAAAAGSGAGRARSTYVGPIQTYQGSTVDDSDCQAKLKALPTGETCLQPTQVCVDASPTTRTINGVAVTHDCWQWQATYQCSTLSSANDCATLSAKSNCSFDHEVCLDPRRSVPVRSRARSTNARRLPRRRATQPIPAAAMSIASMGAAPSFRHRRRLIWPMRSWR